MSLSRHDKIIYGFLILLTASCVYYCVSYKGIDFYTYLMAAKAFHYDARPYLNLMYTYPYYYPPLTAQLILPLIFMPPKMALCIWLLCSVAAVAASVYLLTDGKKFSIYLLLAFGFLPVETTFYAGQVGAFLLLALSLGYYALSKNNHVSAGFGIALGIMLKVIPIAHLSYFIWRRKMKIVGAALGFLALFFAVSLPFVGGWQGWLDFFHIAAYYGNPASLHAVHFTQTLNVGSNQALSGFFARMIDSDLLSIPVWHASVMILILATAWVCWPRGDFARSCALEFSLVTIAITLVMPYTWYHQYVVLLIPLITLLRLAESEPWLQRMYWPLAVGYVLTDCHGLFWHSLHTSVLTSLPIFFALFLWFIVARQILVQAKLKPHPLEQIAQPASL